MTCAEAWGRLLEADPEELKGTVESDLSRHLTACAACRALADDILDAQSALEIALADARPISPVDAVLQVAASRAEARRRRRSWWAAAPVAAAAGLAGLVLLVNGGSEMPGDVWHPTPVPAASGVDVEAPADRDVVVFDIEDRPDVLVIWFFDKGEE